MKPLTIEQLKSLEAGDWVWIITPTNNGEYYEKGFASDNEAFVGYSLHYQVEVLYSDYGTKWLAYKNKEQAEAKGEIVEMPCKKGDTIYVIAYNRTNKQHYIDTEKVTQTKFEYENGELVDGCVYTFDRHDKLDTAHSMRKFGIRWFTDKSQAEARLKELQGE